MSKIECSTIDSHQESIFSILRKLNQVLTRIRTLHRLLTLHHLILNPSLLPRNQSIKMRFTVAALALAAVASANPVKRTFATCEIGDKHAT